jgi:hypothetical protein
MKKLKMMLSDGSYNALYQKLEEIHFCYDLEGFAKTFEGVGSEKKYAFLMYAIAKNEKPDLHLLICDLLSYTDTFFFDRYTLQKWHLKRALEISPNNIQALQWIICTFDGHPDSPFSTEELVNYSKKLEELQRAPPSASS